MIDGGIVMEEKCTIHLDIDAKIPHYHECKKQSCKKKIQEIMCKYEYDEDFIKNIDGSFCQGFGVARDIIFNILKEKYWKQG